jgi:hypothetical protein
VSLDGGFMVHCWEGRQQLVGGSIRRERESGVKEGGRDFAKSASVSSFSLMGKGQGQHRSSLELDQRE